MSNPSVSGARTAADASPENDLETRRFRVVSGCVECASDLTPLQRVEGVREVRMLAASGILAVTVVPSVDDAQLRRTASASGLVLEPERHAPSDDDTPGPRNRWWLRPEMICLAVSAVCALISTVVYRTTGETSLAIGVVAAVGVVVGLVFPARNAWTAARAGRFTINILLLVTVAGAVPLGRIVEASGVVVIFSLGVVLESFVADRARRSIQKLMDLSPRRAERLTGDGAVEVVPVEEIRVGDLVLVRPGSRLPADGTVVDGTSWVDTSAITGESIPEEVVAGHPVFGGTLNGNGALRVRAEKGYEDTVLARIIREVEEAQQNRGQAQRFADRFAGVYTPIMIGLAVLTAVFGPIVFGLTFVDAFYRALVILIVSCSCALVISVPVGVVSAVARAARDGILIKGGVHLEMIPKIRTIAFDKTGTLTIGRPGVTHLIAFDADERELLRMAAAVESAATHPIAESVVRATRDRGIPVQPAPDAQITVGSGASGTVDGRRVDVGRIRPQDEQDPALAEHFATIERDGASPVGVHVDDRLVGLLGVADELRPESADAIDGLRRLGIEHCVMLTGDRDNVARRIAAELGLDDVRARLMPADKSSVVADLRRRDGVVAMVGDGVNDAPALAAADVSIVMAGGGADVAIETADVALMSDDLTKLPYTIALGRRARRIIGQNIALSLVVIAALVVAALAGSFNLTQGVLINEACALLIIANGLRLLRGRALPSTRGGADAGSAASGSTAPPVLADVSIGAPSGDAACGCDAGTEAVPAPAPPAGSTGCGCGPAATGCCAPAEDTSVPRSAGGR